jgi:hypothetical protein
MRIKHHLPIAIAVLLGITLLMSLADQPVQAQDGNLLTNPSFEGEYSAYIPELPQEIADCALGICQTAQTAAGWKPWWVKERPTDVNPEFKPAISAIHPNRVRSGDRAGQYFSFWSTHKAGLRQTVTVPANSVVQFTVWGHSWLQESDTLLTSDFAGTSNMRIGIDPNGGVDVYSPAIVWSGFQQAFDTFQLFSVQAQANGDKVTVFTFSAPDVNPNSPTAGFKHTDIYWDDASLSVVGAGSAPPTSNNDTTSSAAVQQPSIVLGPTATPDAEGIIYYEVQSGDSLWAIAARAGMDLDELLEINDLARSSVIKAGEIYITGYGDPPEAEAETAEPTPENTPEPVAEEAAEKEPEPTPVPQVTPEVVAVTELERTGATICLTAFDDPNENGIMDAAETLRPAVAFTISDSQSVVSNYVTDGNSEPFCIQGLDAGSYKVTRSHLPNELLTTPGDQAVSLAEGTAIELDFGSVLGDEVASVNDASESASDSAQGSEDDGLLNTLIIASVVVGVLLLIAVVILLVTRRRESTS